jgi:hypothetical protein
LDVPGTNAKFTLQTAVVEKIALASCCPFKEIAVFNLQK